MYQFALSWLFYVICIGLFCFGLLSVALHCVMVVFWCRLSVSVSWARLRCARLVYWLCLGCVSVVSRLLLTCVVVASWSCLRCVLVVFGLRVGYGVIAS